jgi:FkbM family methyltransferase
MKKASKKASGRIVILVMSFLLFAAMCIYISLINELRIRHTDAIIAGETSAGNSGGGISSRDARSLKDRIEYLETKVDSYLAYHKDPFLSTKVSTKCKQLSTIKEIACPNNDQCAVDNSNICMDGLPFQVGDDQHKKEGCIIYDFGIRESPEFGMTFAKQCDVVGFDPSPISIDWWKKEQDAIQKEHPNYSFSPVGAGGIDGKVVLREYDWGQVSIIEFPTRVIDTTNCNGAGACKYTFHEQQKSFEIPVQTLRTAMKEHGHSRVSLLKLDVEGSEYAFLETMIDDLSCRKVDQLVLEWHHYDHDVRYGVTSNPQINVLVALLKERCGLEQFWIHGSKGWPSNQKLYAEMGMTLYYSLSSFKRTRWEF